MLLNREHSTAQQRNTPCTKQQTKHVPIRLPIKEVCTYMHAASRLFPGAWSSWPLQVACLHLKCWTIYFITTSACHSNPCFFVSERSGRNRCTGIRKASAAQQQQYVRVCMFSLKREHSKAQHSTVGSAITPARSKQKNKFVPISLRIKRSMYVRTCMLRPVCFPGAWSC